MYKTFWETESIKLNQMKKKANKVLMDVNRPTKTLAHSKVMTNFSVNESQTDVNHTETDEVLETLRAVSAVVDLIMILPVLPA